MIWPSTNQRIDYDDDQVFVCDIDPPTEVKEPLSKMLASTV